MNEEQLAKMTHGTGFIAALDQSGGSTPAALERYGIPRDAYSDNDAMFALMHEMRTRIITNPSFTGERIIATILFEDTIDRHIGGLGSAEYLWEQKRIVPILKVDKGLAPEASGARCMAPMPGLDMVLAKARQKGAFGTKMRSFIRLADRAGVEAVVVQQFEVARQICAAGLVPILEPEVDITSPDKAAAETLLSARLADHLDRLRPDEKVILKLTLPDHDDLYGPLIDHRNVLRVAALSGGYSREVATERLARNHRMIASFSRALTEGLTVNMTNEEFTAALAGVIAEVYAASVT